MVTALNVPDFSAQPRQWVGARFARRLGGAVGNVIAGGIALATGLRRPAAPRTGSGRTAARSVDARHAAHQQDAQRQPRTVPPIPSPRPVQRSRLARMLARPSESAPSTHALLPFDPDAPFTLETIPGLCPEIRAILNTPLEDCDPEMLRVLLASFAQAVALSMPPEVGSTDAGLLFSELWGRLAEALGDASPDAPPPWAPANPADIAPDAQAPESDPPAAASSPASAALSDARPASSYPPANPERHAFPEALRILTHAVMPDIARRRESAPDDDCPHADGNLLFRIRIGFASQPGCWRLPGCRSLVRRGLPQCVPSPRWYYAARASPA